MTAPPVKFKGDHFSRRAIERKGVELTREERSAIVRMIYNKETVFIEHTFGGRNGPDTPREIHELWFKNRFWRIVVDIRGGKLYLVTCLPL